MKQIQTTIILSVLILLCLPFGTMAQHCSNFHRVNCNASNNDFFEYNGQSKSALFTFGQTSELPLIIYLGKDYRISICHGLTEDQNVQFKILKSKTKEVLYDNADDDYASDFEFTCAETQKITLEVTIPKGEQNLSKLKTEDYFCLGVLLEHMDTPKSGF